MTTYFASDGSYGTVSGLVIVDTSQWSDDDWTRIAESSDYDRASIAASIAIDRETL